MQKNLFNKIGVSSLILSFLLTTFTIHRMLVYFDSSKLVYDYKNKIELSKQLLEKALNALTTYKKIEYELTPIFSRKTNFWNTRSTVAKIFLDSDKVGLSVEAIQFFSSRHNLYLTSQPIKLICVGTFNQLLHFIQNLKGDLVIIDKMDIKKGSKNVLTITLWIQFYYVNLDYNKTYEPRPKKTSFSPLQPPNSTNTFVRDPFNSTENDFLLKQIKFLGCLITSSYRVAFLNLPNNTTLILSPGMTIGLERARVIDIGEKGVTFQMKNQLNHFIYSAE